MHHSPPTMTHRNLLHVITSLEHNKLDTLTLQQKGRTHHQPDDRGGLYITGRPKNALELQQYGYEINLLGGHSEGESTAQT
jgi:hypothetical protein